MSTTDTVEASASSSSAVEFDPLLKDLEEKRLSFKRNVVSLATELKDVRRRLVLQEQLFARETLTRKASEKKAKSMEEEIGRLQICLQEKDEKLKASTSASVELSSLSINDEHCFFMGEISCGGGRAYPQMLSSIL
ncbi:hypothetical protein MUK42_36240 [Musa troglodytarum]|uniref:Uncharacterized protein n=1 Tax=Musa troglodytarum TaxID=320322 RepID=A0A9E7KWE2_9LILI|nr:hypothetical protein MUK42_36240 [Musa troglodytarum]